MAEPYYTADKGSVSRPTFSGYLSTEVPQLAGASSNFQQRDLNPLWRGSYGLDGYSNVGVRPEPCIGGIMPGASGMGYPNPLEDPSLLLTQRGDASARAIGGAMPGASGMGYPTPLEDPSLLTQRGDASARAIGGAMAGASGMGYPTPLEDPSLLTQRGDASARAIGGAMPGASGMWYPTPLEDPGLLSQRKNASVNVSAAIPDMIHGRPSSVRSADGPPLLKGESNILFVDGLPTDCTRREAGRILTGDYQDLFRPFIGYKEIKVVHKEARNSGDRATVLCFVEFTDAKCATTAMEALQGYKFDDRKPDSPTLKIQFAHFPFRPPSDHDGQRIGILH